MGSVRQPGYFRTHDDTTVMQGIWWCHSHARYIMTSQPHVAHEDITAVQGILELCRMHNDVTACRIHDDIHSHTGNVMATQPCRVCGNVTTVQDMCDVTVVQDTWWHHSHSFTDLETQISWTQQSPKEMNVLTYHVLWLASAVIFFWGGCRESGLIYSRLDLNLQYSQGWSWMSCLFSQVQGL